MKMIKLLILLFCALLTSCVGMIGRAIAIGHGPTYAEARPTFPPLEPGCGRMFIYSPKFGPNIMDSAGMLIDYRVDGGRTRTFGGKSFNFADMPAGDHVVSTHVLGTFCRPKFSVHINPGKSTYIKVDGSYYRLQFNPVDVDVAESEMANLTHSKH